jgi:cytochrome c oxidase subunit 2
VAVAAGCSGGGSSGKTVSGAAARGEQVVRSHGCLGCHSTDGSSGTGPTFKGVYGSRVRLSNGKTVTANDAYVTESIRHPQAKIVAGFSAKMPTFDLSERDIDGVIAYLKTLR